jgi:hypothetical protein
MTCGLESSGKKLKECKIEEREKRGGGYGLVLGRRCEVFAARGGALRAHASCWPAGPKSAWSVRGYFLFSYLTVFKICFSFRPPK